MMKIILNVLLLLFLLCINAGQTFAQTLSDYNTASGQVMSKGIDGIGNIVSSIISDSFTPMTHYKKGDFNLSAVPAWFDVQKAYDSPEIKGDNLTGFAGGLGAGYALNDDLIIYGVAAFMQMKGKLEGDFYKEYFGPLKADTDYRMFSFLFGAGYDMLDGKWSLPVFAGMSMQYYNTKIGLPTQTNALIDPSIIPIGTGNLDTEFSGSGMLYGANAGIAISREFLDTFRITPYYLYTISFNKAELDNKTSITSTTSPYPSYSYESGIEGQRVSSGMLGLCLTLMSSKGFSFSLSLGGILTSSSSWYNDKFLNGLEMKSAVAVLAYTSNFNNAE